jgi:hypothetical protein
VSTLLRSIAAGAIMAAACAAAAADGMRADPDAVTLAGVRLQVTEQGGQCYLASVNARGGERSHRLDMPAPCAFHNDPAGTLRTIRNGKSDYALIESSKAAGAGTSDCETQLRAIRAAGGQVHVSQHKDKLASCPPFQWDRMLFTELFD